jgi:hypothetical protein
VVNLANHTYSAYVTPAGQSEQLIGQNYAFRTEQATANSLSYFNVIAFSSSYTACSFTIGSTSQIALVQEGTFSLQPSANGTVSLTLPQATGAGNALLIGVSFWPSDITSVSDSSGDGFTRGLTTSIYHNSQGPMYTNFYYAKNTAGGATTITLNFSGGSPYVLVAVSEVSGLDTTAPLDQSAYNESLIATTSWSSASVTTTAAKEYLFSWAANEYANLTCSSPSSGWTIESQVAIAGSIVCMVDRIVSAAGSYQASVTVSAAQNYAMEVVTFKGKP